MTTLVLYSLVSTAFYYLMARAKITQWLWSRYPTWLDYWVTCAACFGFWAGIACGALGSRFHLTFLELEPGFYGIVASGLSCMVTTPILAYAMVTGWLGLMPEEIEDPEE